MNEPVLDASAALSVLQAESGSEVVSGAISSGGVISAVNLAEVVTKFAGHGMSPLVIQQSLVRLSVGALSSTG